MFGLEDTLNIAVLSTQVHSRKDAEISHSRKSSHGSQLQIERRESARRCAVIGARRKHKSFASTDIHG